MSIFKRLSLCTLFASLIFIPSFAQHFLGAFSGVALQIDTQIETPVQNNNVQTLPEQKAGDTIRFQLFVPAGAGQSTNGYTVELDLPGKTFSSYIGNVSGTDWTGGALISTNATQLSALFLTGASVPSTGYIGQLDLQVTKSLEGGATLIVKSLSMTSGSDIDMLDVSNAIITFTASATGSGDFDGNGTVNIADFLMFVDVFGKSSSDVGYDARMDLDGNGTVNLADFLAFVDVFGTTPSTGGGQGGGQGGGGSSVIPSPPDNARYRWDSSFSQYQISWDPVPDATSYRVYYDTATQFDVSCPGSCREIATVRNTSIAHFKDREGEPTLLSFRKIGYWVRACNDAGCSSYVRASRSGGASGAPPPPNNVKYQWDPSISQYQISWDPVPDATSYRVYYDHASLLSVSCPGGCRRIATVSDTTISHYDNRRYGIGYWVRACNDAGCSNYATASRDDDIGSDLIVKSASVSNDSLNAGQSFTLNVTVRNQGNRQSPATILRYYRSSDQMISKGDTEVGADAVSSLSTSGATSKSISLTASSSYYYGACVDAVNNENNIKNNCSSSISVIVGGQPLTPPPPPPIIELDASNRSPGGITYANDRFYVVDYDKVYAYLSSGQRDPALDFDLSPDNRFPSGITYANDRFYVLDDSQEKVYAYLSSGQRDPASDFDLSSDQAWPEGITYANDRVYVVDNFRDNVYAYLSSGQRDPASDFDLSSRNNRPKGITYANNRFYVVDDSDDKVYVYLSSGQHDPASDFDLSPDNNSPEGIMYANDRFYVIDDTSTGVARVYVVQPLPGGRQPLPPTTIIELDTSHISPEGITYANDRVYVVDFNDTVYAYMSSGQRDPASDFDLSPDNGSPKGIMYANDRFYVVDTFDETVYAHLSSGQRDPASEFVLSPHQNWPHGITYANDRFYVVDDWDDKVYAYMSSGQRDPASDFDLSSRNTSPRGITYANDRVYVVDAFDDNIYAYMSSGQRDPASEFDLSPDNGSPSGIMYANDRFYVVDERDEKVYVYVVDP